MHRNRNTCLDATWETMGNRPNHMWSRQLIATIFYIQRDKLLWHNRLCQIKVMTSFSRPAGYCELPILLDWRASVDLLVCRSMMIDFDRVKNLHFRPCPPVRDWYWPCIWPCFHMRGTAPAYPRASRIAIYLASFKLLLNGIQNYFMITLTYPFPAIHHGYPFQTLLEWAKNLKFRRSLPSMR